MATPNKERFCVVFDFETTGLEVESGKDHIVQIGATIIDMKAPKVDETAEFNIVVCPPDLHDEDFYDKHKSALDKHMEWTGKTLEELKSFWDEEGVPEKDALKEFLKFCKNYKKGGNPLCGGHNVVRFDIPILEMLCQKYKVAYPFLRTSVLDSQFLSQIWFLYSDAPPLDFRMDSLRKRFAMASENAHDALQDVRDEATVIQRFLALHKTITPKIPAINTYQWKK